MRTIGIDIGSYSVKVAEVIQTKKGIQLVSITEHLLGQNPAFDSELEIVEILRALAIQYDPISTKYVVGLKQEWISQRLKIFPFNDRHKILKTLPFEIEEEIPFTLENAISDARITRLIGSTTEVLALVVPKTLIEKSLSRFEGPNLKINILTAESIALANVIEPWGEPFLADPMPTEEQEKDPPKRKLTLLIDIGHSRTHVLAFDRSRLIASRTINWGSKNISETIAKRYEIPFVDAVKEMNSKSFVLLNKDGASYDQMIFSDTIGKVVRDLGRQLKMASMEFQSDFNAQVIGAEITGGGSQIINLGAFLTMQLETPVNVCKWLNHFQNNGDIPHQLEATGGLAVGLATEGFRKPKNPAINFRKDEFVLQNQSSKIFWETWGGTVRLLGIVFVITLIFGNIREYLAATLVEKTYEVLGNQAKTVAKLSQKQANEAGVKVYIKNEKERIKETKALLGVINMNSAMDILKNINDLIPGKDQMAVQVKKLDIIDDQVFFEGTTTKPDGGNQIKQALQRISIDGKVQGSATPAPERGQNFSFQLKVDRGLNKQK